MNNIKSPKFNNINSNYSLVNLPDLKVLRGSQNRCLELGFDVFNGLVFDGLSCMRDHSCSTDFTLKKFKKMIEVFFDTQVDDSYIKFVSDQFKELFVKQTKMTLSQFNHTKRKLYNDLVDNICTQSRIYSNHSTISLNQISITESKIVDSVELRQLIIYATATISLVSGILFFCMLGFLVREYILKNRMYRISPEPV